MYDDNCAETNDTSNLPMSATQADYIIAQRDLALNLAQEAASELARAFTKVKRAVATANLASGGQDSYFRYAHSENRHYQSLFNDQFDASSAIEAFRKRTDAEIWNAIMDATGIRSLMDAQAFKEYQRGLADEVPAVTTDNLRATLETLHGNREKMFLRGVANVFSKLDRHFKSHDSFKMGGRIVMSHVCGYSGGFCRHTGRSAEIDDMDRALRKLVGKEDRPGALTSALADLQGRHYGPRQLFFQNDYVKVRVFQNGNAHIYLDEAARAALNRALARYYGDVVPDAAPRGMGASDFKARHVNLPSKDLAFYPTPAAVCDELLHDAWLFKGQRILEPSAGTGAIVKALLEKLDRTSCQRDEAYRVARSDVVLDVVEIHPARCQVLRARHGGDCNVILGNFLDRKPHATYDLVLMNPPFHGTHWMDHVRHAFDFLKPGGELRAVLPITAAIGESARHAAFSRWLDAATKRYSWGDLPAESFAESGAMIQTTILRLKRA